MISSHTLSNAVMEISKWKKIENEAGYPCYIEEPTSKQQYDHPEFLKIIESLNEYDEIKYSAYRIAFKIYALQKHLKVPALRLSSGVFARHQLSLSESSLSLDTAELEAVLGDIYFAAEKEGLFTGDVDLAVDLMINLLLNVYDKDRKEPIRVLAAKTLLIILSEETCSDKWAALANSSADHNGCVSPKRLASLLAHVTALSTYLGGTASPLQNDVDACFEKNAGMLGLSSLAVAQWGAGRSGAARWLAVLQRVAATRHVTTPGGSCSNCNKPLVQMLKFQCMKCNEVYFCEKCYLYDRELSVSGHKKTHVVHEIIDGQTKPPQCLSFIKSMRRFFFCTKTKKRKTSKPSKEPARRRPAMVTSTVGRAGGGASAPGGGASGPGGGAADVLQDVITQLETQNKALEDLTSHLKELATDEKLKVEVEFQWNHISTQINRLKTLKDNLSQTDAASEKDKLNRPQSFDLFSPILIDKKESKVNSKTQTRPKVLSLDSGNFSVVSKNADSENLLTVSGDALRPLVAHTSDSISTVSINDISCMYHEQESLAPSQRQSMKLSLLKPVSPLAGDALAACEADLRRVENTNHHMRELNKDMDTVLDRLHQILANNFAMDDSCFDNTQLRETANEMEGLIGTLIRGVEQRATLNASNALSV